MTLRPEDIDGLSLEEATDWLDEKSISYDLLETHGEILDLIKATLKTGIASGRQFVNSDEMMPDCLTKDDEMKSELSKFYDDLRLFVEQNLEDELKTVINNIYSDIDTRLERNKDNLINSDCAIVVAGETGAGKSSFLNLLLGTDVLPHSLLSNTSVICKIHKSDKKRWFKVVRKNGESQIFTIEDEGPMAEEGFVKKLSQYIGKSGLDHGDNIRHVDIYWPVPMLKEGVTLVDTPGTGENPEMTEKLVKYLPNAVAFIYIVNSANAGGIQEDTILHIISEQKKLDTDQELSGFDPASMIFVCNKWDIVERRKFADDTWRDTVRRLQMTIPGLNENHIFKLSVTEATRYRRSGIGNTLMYQHLLEGLEKFIPDSLIAHIKRHYRWIYSLLSKLEVSVASRINNARKTSDEKEMFQREVTARLRKLERESVKVRTRLIEAAEKECRFIKEELHKFLSREDIRSFLQTWTEEEASDIIENDLDVTQFRAQDMILKRLLNVIQTWGNETGIVENASQNLTRTFNVECFLLSRGCREVDEIMKESAISDLRLDLFLGGQSKSTNIPLDLEASEIGIIVATSPIWVPLGIVALAIFVPVGLGAGVVRSIKRALEKKEYKKDKAKYMKKWTLDSLQKLDNISRLIDMMYLDRYIARIDKVCCEFIPKQIKADRSQLHNIVTDKRTASQIIHQFQPKKDMLEGMFQKLYLFDLRYLAGDVIRISTILRNRRIGSGSFSDVYHATWRKANCDEKEVALKILKGRDIYLQLSEVDCSRRLKHQNIVEFYGVIFAERERYRSDGAGARVQAQDIGLPLYDDRLMIVLELCDQTLESLVFGTTELQCGSYPDNLRGRKTHQFFFEMAVSVCEGLAYMHGMKFLHRDLKLSNVLVKDDVGKLCDLGFARAEVAITGKAVGTLTHMAPELLRDNIYSFSSDVYSLGILLWELWYGKRSYSDAQFGNLAVGPFIDAVTGGKRPNCYTEYSMFPHLKNLVEKCWDNDPNGRPKVGEVKTELMQIDVKHRKNISR